MILVDAEKLGILLATVQELHRKIDTLSTHINAGTNSSNLFTIEAACQHLGVNRRTLLNYRNRGQLVYSQAPGSSRVFFLQSDLDAFIKRYRCSIEALLPDSSAE